MNTQKCGFTLSKKAKLFSLQNMQDDMVLTEMNVQGWFVFVLSSAGAMLKTTKCRGGSG